jgi:hypothetical protein
MEKIFIIAGTFGQFREFRKQLSFVMAEEGIAFSHTDFVYVGSHDTLRGTNKPWGYKVGNWYKRDDIELINQAIRISRSDPDVDFIPVVL